MKGSTAEEVIRIVESIAPPGLAEEWDNPGLAVGSPDQPVTKVWVALDPLPQVVEAACSAGVDLLITHHPLLMRPLSKLDLSTPLGEIIAMAVENRLTLYSAHTNLDKALGGVNDVLAEKIGLKNLSPLVKGKDGEPGLGRTGELPRPMELGELAEFVKAGLDLKWVRAIGSLKKKASMAALCSGSGSSLLPDFFASGAEVFITGDIGYHHARSVEEAGLGCLDIGHFASEHLVLDSFAERIKKEAAALGLEIEPCRLEVDPFAVY